MIKFKNNIGNTLLQLRNFRIQVSGKAFGSAVHTCTVGEYLSNHDNPTGIYMITWDRWIDDKVPGIHIKYDAVAKQWINGGHDGKLFK